MCARAGSDCAAERIDVLLQASALRQTVNKSENRYRDMMEMNVVQGKAQELLRFGYRNECGVYEERGRLRGRVDY